MDLFIIHLQKIKINKHREKENRKNHKANILQNTINLKWMDESVTSNRNRFVYLTNRIKVTHLLNKLIFLNLNQFNLNQIELNRLKPIHAWIAKAVATEGPANQPHARVYTSGPFVNPKRIGPVWYLFIKTEQTSIILSNIQEYNVIV